MSIIQKRPLPEILAFHRGQIAAYEMLLKVWPISKDELESFLAMSRGMLEMDQEKAG